MSVVVTYITVLLVTCTRTFLLVMIWAPVRAGMLFLCMQSKQDYVIYTQISGNSYSGSL